MMLLRKQGASRRGGGSVVGSGLWLPPSGSTIGNTLTINTAGGWSASGSIYSSASSDVGNAPSWVQALGFPRRSFYSYTGGTVATLTAASAATSPKTVEIYFRSAYSGPPSVNMRCNFLNAAGSVISYQDVTVISLTSLLATVTAPTGTKAVRFDGGTPPVDVMAARSLT